MMLGERLLCGMYVAVLRLLPRSFRRVYEHDMLETFRSRIRTMHETRNLLTAYLVAVRETMGAVSVAWQEHVAARSATQAAGRTRPNSPLRERLAIVASETRRSARGLAKAPQFVIPAILTLAIGIGANTTIFGVFRGVILNPLPYPDADRIVWLDHSAAGIDLESGLGLTRGLYIHYGEQQVFTSIALFDETALTLRDGHGPVQIDVARVTPSTSEVLQVLPELGRWFPSSMRRADERLLMLSYELWVERYAKDPQIIGSTVSIQGIPYEIIGVMPASYDFPKAETEAWIPLRVDQDAGFGGFEFRAIARLASGITSTDAQNRLNAAIPLLPSRFSDPFAAAVVTDAKIRALVTSLKDERVGDIRATLWILLGGVSLVFFVACLNVTNLVLVRAEAQSHETGVRAALGATPLQVVRQQLLETLLFTLAGAGVGVAFAWLGLEALRALNPADIPRLQEISLDAYVFGFCAVLTLVTTVVLTAIRYARSTRSNHAVSGWNRGATSTASADRFRQLIATAQVSLALVLLVGSGLMLKTFHNIRDIDLGFSHDHVVTFEIGLPPTDYPTRRQASDFQRALVERISALPGAVAVGGISRCLPLGGWCGGDPLAVEGRSSVPGEIPKVVALRTASPGYISAMQIPLLAGRWLEARDEGSNVAVVSEALAEHYWPDRNPIGERVSDLGAATPDSSWYTVVGVVGNTPAREVTDVQTPMIYFPQKSRSGRGPSPHTMRVVVRTRVAPLSLVPAIRKTVTSLDPSVPVANVKTLDDVVSSATARTTFAAILLGIASTMALVLGTIGVYAIMTYTVARRRGEISIRMALGASRKDVRGLIMRRAMWVAGIGCAIGVTCAASVSRYLESLLFQVSPTDGLTYATVVSAIVAVTFIASYVPAQRAARMSPARALRG